MGSLQMASPLTVQVSVEGVPCQALIDSGSCGNFISYAMLRSLRSKTVALESPFHVKVASGATLPVDSCVHVEMLFGDVEFPVRLHVAELNLPIILGLPFLEQV